MKFSREDVIEAHQTLIGENHYLRCASDYGTYGTFIEIRGEDANLVVSRLFDNIDEPKDGYLVNDFVDSPQTIVQEGDRFRWAGLQAGSDTGIVQIPPGKAASRIARRQRRRLYGGL